VLGGIQHIAQLEGGMRNYWQTVSRLVTELRVPRLHHRALPSWKWPPDAPLDDALKKMGVKFDEFAIAPSAAAVTAVREEAADIIRRYAERPGIVNRKTKERAYGALCRNGEQTPKTGLPHELGQEPPFRDWPPLVPRKKSGRKAHPASEPPCEPASRRARRSGSGSA
jgi:hypothetical protein